MANIRRRRTRNFTVVENEVFNDDRLSLEAMGLLAWLRSRPDNWCLSVDHGRKRFKVGRNKMHDLVRELIETGWIVSERIRDPKTKAYIGIEYVVFDEAKPVEPRSENGDVAQEPESEEPRPDLPEVEKPRPANGDDLIRTDSEQELFPPNPQGGMGEIEDQISDSKDAFDRFHQAWISDPTISWHVVEKRFMDLTSEEQELAAETAPRYIAWCAKHGRKLKGPTNWLRGKGWEGFAEEERATAAAVQSAQTKVWVREGSPQWQAIARSFERSRKRMPAPMTCKAEPGLGWWFDAELLKEQAA